VLKAVAHFMRRHVFDVVMILLFGATLVLGIWGWAEYFRALDDAGRYDDPALRRLSDILFRTLRAFVFGDEYADLDAQFESWKLIGAGWCGAIVAMGALLRAGLKLFYGPWARWRASFRSGHAVVLGERDFARQAAEALAGQGCTVTHHTGLIEMEHDGVLATPRRHSLDDGFMRESLNGAERIVVAETTDSATAQTALDLAERWPDTPIFAVFENPWLAEGLRHSAREKGDWLISVSECAATARTALVSYPPYRAALEKGQDRIHAVIVGFDRLGESILEDLLNSALHPELKLPRVTIIDREADRCRAAFEARHPYLTSESGRAEGGPIDIAFVSGDAGVIEEAGITALKAVIDQDPVTMVYVAVGEASTPLAVALALREQSRRHGLFDAPILVRARDGCGIDRAVPGSAEDDEFCPLGAFGQWSDLVRATGVLDDEPDDLARGYHESYMRMVWKASAADADWTRLGESYRASNRRAIAHIPAKLGALGFDLTVPGERASAG